MTAELECVLDVDVPVAVVRVDGLLTMASAVRVRTALHKCLAAQPVGVVIDVSDLTVETEVGLSVFSAFARAAAAWPGCPVAICGAQGRVLTALRRIALSGSLPVYPDRAVAIAAVIALPAPRRYWCRLPPSPMAAREAREIVAAACTAWRLPHVSGAAELVATELVTNAVRHAGTALEFTVALRDRFVHIAVRDGSRVRPERLIVDPGSAEGGRGLLLVDALTAGWGSTATDDGKVVWATLRIRAGRYGNPMRPPSA